MCLSAFLLTTEPKLRLSSEFQVIVMGLRFSMPREPWNSILSEFHSQGHLWVLALREMSPEAAASGVPLDTRDLLVVSNLCTQHPTFLFSPLLSGPQSV